MIYCKDNDILKKYVVAHSPEQNGVAERKNKIIVECARSMLKEKKLPNNVWTKVVNTAMYLLNIRPTKYLENKTLYEAFHGVKPVVSHLRIFGSKEDCHNPKENRRKLNAKSFKCIFVSYCIDHKAYRMYNSTTHRVFSSRDVIFHEFADDVQVEEKVDKTISLKLLEEDNESSNIVDLQTMIKEWKVILFNLMVL